LIGKRLNQFGSVVGRKLDQAIMKPNSGYESDKCTAHPWNFRHGSFECDARLAEMVGLHPKVGAWKRFPPILFHITPAVCKIDDFPLNIQFAFNVVIHAQNTMVTFHERNKGIGAHDAWRIKRTRPLRPFRKMQFTLYRW